MHYVILRDDDTNALTPPGYLDWLYQPFLDRGMPVTLSVVPNVRTDVKLPDGSPEGFLVMRNGESRPAVPITDNLDLLRYLKENPGYHFAQHGYDHSREEFARTDPKDLQRRIDQGSELLLEAGFEQPLTFVAPHDRFSPRALAMVSSRFPVISSGWYELRRLPVAWWPRYLLKKTSHHYHWRAGGAWLLSHPGCLLSYTKPCGTMLENILGQIKSRSLTVLVTHWWEYFRGGEANEPFIEILHSLAEELDDDKDVEVISFDDIALHGMPAK